MNNTENKKSSPRLAKILLQLCIRSYEKRTIIDDLDELYQYELTHSNKFFAWFWYWMQAIKSLLNISTHNGAKSMEMFKLNIKVTLRNLYNQKLYSSLNISGLAIAIAACILILLYVQNELNYNQFHVKGDRIFRIEPTLRTSGESLELATSSAFHGPMAKDNFPEIENYVRFSIYREKTIFSYENKVFEEKKHLHADSTLFTIFSFELLKGDPRTALKAPNSILLTEKMAEKYFGSDEPLGKVLTDESSVAHTVTGVLKNIPVTSHFKPDFISSFSSLQLKSSGDKVNDILNRNMYYTYVLLREGADYKQLDSKLTGYYLSFIGPIIDRVGGSAELHIRPLKDIYLRSDRYGELEAVSDITYVYLFSGIGIFILFIGIMNYVNLATARSTNRAKEIGMRKVAGAFRTQIIYQFLGESLFTASLALGVALLLAKLSIPFFNNLSGKELAINLLSNPQLLVGIIGLFIFTGFAGGSYPAFLLSSFKPVEVIKGIMSGNGKKLSMREVLVTLQLTVSLALIIATLISSDQINYLMNKNLGYDKDQLLAIRLRSPATASKFESIKEELLAYPDIISASASSSLPLRITNDNVHQPAGKPESESVFARMKAVDTEFIDTYKIKILEGRNFSKEFPSDPASAIIINESIANKVGWKEGALGQKIHPGNGYGTPYTIIGIIENYHFDSLHEPVMPLVLYNSNFAGRYEYITLRLSGKNVPETINYLEDKWQEFDSSFPFEMQFLDESYASLYSSEVKLGQLFKYFSALAIIISCLGLIGLASFTAEQKTKEIGIRKVLGASVNSIISLQMVNILKWIALAAAFASPIGYFLMTNWLNSFAYRAGINVLVFFTGTLLILVIAIMTISFQSIKAARSNPVHALKHE